MHANFVAKLVVLAMVLVSGLASAASTLDASIATGLAGVQADAVAILALVFPVIIAVFGMTMAPKLVKRFGRMI